MYVSLYIHMRVYIYLSVYIYAHINRYTYNHTYIHMCIYIFIYVYIYLHIHIIYIHIYTYIFIHIYIIHTYKYILIFRGFGHSERQHECFVLKNCTILVCFYCCARCLGCGLGTGQWYPVEILSSPPEYHSSHEGIILTWYWRFIMFEIFHPAQRNWTKRIDKTNRKVAERAWSLERKQGVRVLVCVCVPSEIYCL